MERHFTENTVGAVVIEPFATLIGAQASLSFYNRMIELAQKHGSSVIIDETHTGYHGSGESTWMSDKYSSRPDYVVFGKRSLASGYFANSPKSNQESSGDVKKLLQLKVANSVVKSEGL